MSTRPPGGRAGAVVERRLLVVGAGLIGTSVALAAQRAGWAVDIEDVQPDRERAARERLDRERLDREQGNGSESATTDVTDPPGINRPPLAGGGRADVRSANSSLDPALICIAVSPQSTVDMVLASLRRYVTSTVIDVSSVKAQPQSHIEAQTPEVDRFIGTHPIAGSEGSGPAAARIDLFRGRSWVLCPHAAASPERIEQVEELIVGCLAHPVRLAPREHDRLLAVTSHLPQVLASALAALVDGAFTQTADEPGGAGKHSAGIGAEGSPERGPEASRGGAQARATPRAVPGRVPSATQGAVPGAPSRPGSPEPAVLAGPALLDMTRIAGSPGELWGQIAEANVGPLRDAVADLVERLTEVRDRLSDPKSARAVVGALVDDGRAARGRMGLKHAGTQNAGRGRTTTSGWTWVDSVVDDTPGALARIFATAARIGVNVEDVQVDHAPFAAAGVVSVALRDPVEAVALREALRRQDGTLT